MLLKYLVIQITLFVGHKIYAKLCWNWFLYWFFIYNFQAEIAQPEELAYMRGVWDRATCSMFAQLCFLSLATSHVQKLLQLFEECNLTVWVARAVMFTLIFFRIVASKFYICIILSNKPSRTENFQLHKQNIFNSDKSLKEIRK